MHHALRKPPPKAALSSCVVDLIYLERTRREPQACGHHQRRDEIEVTPKR